jgi:large subunit ribosomal protein L6
MYTKKLEIIGVGYNVLKKENELIFQLGRSHANIKKIEEGLDVSCDKTQVIISGKDKLQVSTFADQIRRLKKPERYKGKGIRYVNEVLLLKKVKKK